MLGCSGRGTRRLVRWLTLTTLAYQVPGTGVFWLPRGNDLAKSFGGGANDKLVARGVAPGHGDPEKAAHRFAGAFLMPADAIRADVGASRSSWAKFGDHVHARRLRR